MNFCGVFNSSVVTEPQAGNQAALGGLLGGLGGGGSGGLGGLGGLLGGASSGSVLGGGLGDLLKQFQQNRHGDAAKSWVETGPNTELDDRQLSEALGPEFLEDLSTRTGLSPDEILSRLTATYRKQLRTNTRRHRSDRR